MPSDGLQRFSIDQRTPRSLDAILGYFQERSNSIEFRSTHSPFNAHGSLLQTCGLDQFQCFRFFSILTRPAKLTGFGRDACPGRLAGAPRGKVQVMNAGCARAGLEYQQQNKSLNHWLLP